jgi:16S rRNA processing protein RimM
MSAAGPSRQAPKQAPPGTPERIVVGRIIRPHGLRGEVTVEILSDAPDRFAPGAHLDAHTPDQPDQLGRPRPLTVAATRPQQGRLLVRFDGLDGRDAVESLRGHLLTIQPEAARPLEPGEYWPWQLTGLDVADATGTVRGTVEEVVPGAAHDLLQIRLAGGGTALLPCVAAVLTVDLDARRVTVTGVAGLLDED